MNDVHLYFKEEYKSSFLRLSCMFSHLGMEKEIWFQVPVEFAHLASDLADPFLLGVIFPAMEWNATVFIHNKPVSRGIVFNLIEFQRAWHKWRPEKYSVVNIVAPEQAEIGVIGNQAISAYTGGVDGAFILHENVVAPGSPSIDIAASLFIHGFDIPLDEEIGFSNSLADIRNVTDSLGIPLISIKTNLRDFGDWNDTHGAAIIACLTLFNKRFRIGLIGSSHPYDYLRFPWGSNPITDPMLSSDRFRVQNIGGGYSRIEKLEHISDWKIGNNYLRVCTKRYHNNCGVCEKCLRTMLCYWTLNKKLPPTFENTKITPFSVLRILAFKEQEIKDYKNVYRAAKARHKINPVVYALGLNLWLNRIIRSLNMGPFRHVEFSPKFVRALKRFFTS